MRKSVRERIASGVALLDERVGPDWPEKIQLRKLDVGSGYDCVLGQLFGSFTVGVERVHIGLSASMSYGFADSMSYAQLTPSWKETIAALKKARRKATVAT